MDTMRLTKIAAGVLGAWLVLLLGKWVGSEVYHSASHGEASYVIEVETAEADDAVDEVPFEEIMASADIDKGAKVFKKCSSCHKIEAGENATGPYLHGVVGRDIASADGFASYSGALGGLEGNWTYEALDGFLKNPKNYASGTTMGFAGLKKVEDRANVIAYLESLND